MKHLVISTVALSLCVAAAAAQDQAATRIYVMSEMCTPERMGARVYPQRALERDRSGQGTIDCTLDDAHRPVTCVVVAESEPGWGWGEAAVQGSCLMDRASWRRPNGSNARNYDDDDGVVHARRTVRFQLSNQQP